MIAFGIVVSRNTVLSVLVLVAAIGFFAIKASTGKHLPTPDAQAEAGDLDSRALGTPDAQETLVRKIEAF